MIKSVVVSLRGFREHSEGVGAGEGGEFTEC